MAPPIRFQITAFQRKPGLWRADVAPISVPASVRVGLTTLGFVTDEDCSSEEDAVAAANRAIRKNDR